MIDPIKLEAFSPRLKVYLSAVNQCLVDAALATNERVADFLAQWAHETAGFVYSREIWGPTPAQLGYEGRADLGNTQAGDGRKFMGRGWCQLTGRRNYARASAALFPADPTRLVLHPELVEQPPLAATIAAWYWREGNPSGVSLNRFVERNDFVGLTKAINGGTNGLASRLAWRKKAHDIFVGKGV